MTDFLKVNGYFVAHGDVNALCYDSMLESIRLFVSELYAWHFVRICVRFYKTFCQFYFDNGQYIILGHL